MRAAVYHGREDIRVEDRTEPPMGPTEVRIRVAACGICGSDVHEYTSGPILVPDSNHPLTGESLPLTLGHEVGGMVVDRGRAVTGVETGDAVVLNPVLHCNGCRYCAQGAYHLCDVGGFVGLARDGGLAEQVVVPEANVVPLPQGVDAATGALVEPLAVAVHAIRRSGLQLGDAVAVFGAGPIGLAIVQATQAAGAKTVLVSEPQDERRALAAELGADVTVDPTTADPVDRVRACIDGGADVAFEVAGVVATFNQSIRATRKNGTVAVVSLFEDEVTMQPQTAIPGEREVVGTLAYHGGPRTVEDFDRVISLIDRGVFTPDALVTDRIELEAVVTAGFEPLITGGEQVKILVEP